jgi:glycosyltransferase involved in cell wall biosynthesis
MDRVACVIAPSRFMAGRAASSFACPVVHIPNFVPDENPNGDVASGDPYYLYAGVLEEHKGLRVLADAAARYGGPRRFILIGRGTEEPHLRELAARAGSHIEVRSWADRSALDVLYRDAAAFLMPSTCLENAPLAAIEALSWGTPLLTTSRGGVPELLHDGAAGLAFEPDGPGILRALASFETLPDASRMRRAARKAYETHHRPGVYLDRYLALVRTLIAGGPQALREERGQAVATSAKAVPQEA